MIHLETWHKEADSIEKELESLKRNHIDAMQRYLISLVRSGKIKDLDKNQIAAFGHFGALRGMDLTGAYLNRVNLSGLDLRGVNFSKADLRGANLTYSDLRGTIWTGASADSALFDGADLSGTDLSDATLFGARFIEANLDGANLSRADYNHPEDLMEVDGRYRVIAYNGDPILPSPMPNLPRRNPEWKPSRP